MAGREQVGEYVRQVNGKTVRVKAHSRVNDEATTAILQAPGRPRMAAVPGAFAGNRAVPGVWAQDLQKNIEKKTLAKKKNVEVTAPETATPERRVRKKFSSDAAETKAQLAEEKAVLDSLT